VKGIIQDSRGSSGRSHDFLCIYDFLCNGVGTTPTPGSKQGPNRQLPEVSIERYIGKT
jgi:hypothetical protein